MQEIFSDDFKFQTWRRCWIALAEAQHELGLPQITPPMLAEMRAAQGTIDYAVAGAEERKRRHDVMAHVHEYGTHCPTAKGNIHLGATSQYVGCNTDLVQQREALQIIKRQLVNTIYKLAKFSQEHRGLVTLGYTHLQSAQPVTVGYRTALYILDLLLDLDQVTASEGLIQARGAKGTTGPRTDFLELFGGDQGKVEALDRLVCEKLGFARSFPVTGQTYTRKVDTLIANALSGIGASANKFGLDLRILAHDKLVEEPREEGQTGSSAMPYKRNPMRSERMCSLSRKLIGLPINFAQTHAHQMFERTLDDSAIRRMDIPQLFLLTNAVLNLYENIAGGMVVYPAQIRKQLLAELPFIAVETILMDLCKRGGNRQVLHERLKQHSMEAGKLVKEEAKENDLFERLAGDPELGLTREYLDGLLVHPERFAGDAERMTEQFLAEHVQPVLDEHIELFGTSKAEVRV